MADGHLTRAAEVLGDHAYKGGYDLSDVYGKKKSSDTSSSGGIYVTSVEDSPAGPYGGPVYVSPYAKTAAKPTNTPEEYSHSRPPVASSGHGKDDNYGESRPSGYSEGQYSSHPGYGRRPDSLPPAASSGHGTYDNYGESQQSGYVEEGQYSSHPGFARRPDSRPPAASSGHGKYDDYGESRPSGYVEGQYSSRPGFGGEYEIPEERFGGAPDQGHGQKPNYGGEYATEGKYPPSGGYGGRRPVAPYGEESAWPSAPPQPQHWGPIDESDYSEGRIPEPRRPGWQEGEDPHYGGGRGGGGVRPLHNHPESGFTEYETQRPTYGDDQGAVGYGNIPYPGGGRGGGGVRPPHSRPESGFTEYEAQRPTYGDDQGAVGYGNIPYPGGGRGGGGVRPPHSRPESGFTEYEASRPTYGDHQGAVGYGNIPFKHETPNAEEFYTPERFGRNDDGDRLAYETAGLSLGSGGHAGRLEGCSSKRDDSDSSDDEKKNLGRHHEKHHGKHRQDHLGDNYY